MEHRWNTSCQQSSSGTSPADRYRPFLEQGALFRDGVLRAVQDTERVRHREVLVPLLLGLKFSMNVKQLFHFS